MSEREMLLAVLMKRAPKFDSVSQAVHWLRFIGLTNAAVTHYAEDAIGYRRSTYHVEIHLAEIYLMAEELFREQNIYGV